MNPKSLAPNQVRHIKSLLMAGYTAASVARFYGLSAETVRRIGRGESWNSVTIEGEDEARAKNRGHIGRVFERQDLLPVIEPLAPEGSLGATDSAQEEILERLRAAGIVPAVRS